MSKKHYPWDNPEDNEKTRKNPIQNFDYESEEFISELYYLAADGYYDYEIAKKVGIAPSTFCEKCEQYPIMRESLNKGRARVKEMGSERPSVPYFRELTEECEGKTSRILKALNIGFATYSKWLAEDPALQMEVDLQNLSFLERLDASGRVCAAGVVMKVDEDGNDITKFPGFKLPPNPQLFMFYMNSIGAKYGYSGKDGVCVPVSSAISAANGMAGGNDEGVDIERWIEKETEEKARLRKSVETSEAE